MPLEACAPDDKRSFQPHKQAVQKSSPPPIIDPGLLMLAYRSGIFPMADTRDDPDIFWVEPRHRAVLPLDGFHLSRSLARTLRRGRFSVSCNRAFAAVMDACAAPRETEGGQTWISRRIAASYERLHQMGHAHSIECWQDGELVGGLYGVGFDRAFCGESMFSRRADASKVALAWLVAALRRSGAVLLDCQFITPHLASMGAVELPQERYVELLAAAQTPDLASGPYPTESSEGEGAAAGAGAEGAETGAEAEAGGALALPEGFAALLADAAGAGSASSPGNFIAQSLTQTS